MCRLLQVLKEGLHRYLDTLAFFTCLVPGKVFSGTRLADCVAWFFPAGLSIGLLLSLFSWGTLLSLQNLVRLPSVFASLAAGFCWLGMEIFLSRGLHWDGLADLCDALGSSKEGEGFHKVLKDSRIGTFGTLALLTVFTGQFLAASAHAAYGNWLAMLLAPSWGRTLSALPFCLVAPYSKTSLGGKFAPGGTRFVLLSTLCTGILLAGILLFAGTSITGVILLCTSEACLLKWLVETARHHGGISGDFIGACIELGQLLFLLFAF